MICREFAKEKARQQKSGEFHKIREKHMIEDAVKGYLDWITQAEDLEDVVEHDDDNDSIMDNVSAEARLCTYFHNNATSMVSASISDYFLDHVALVFSYNNHFCSPF